MNLFYRKAQKKDLSAIVSLLFEDELGQSREEKSSTLDDRYKEAFTKINQDPNQYIMIVEQDQKIIGTCHLTFIPSLTFCGSTRMQIEAVRINKEHRGQMIGEQMIEEAIRYGKSLGAKIIQLTSNKQRAKALEFYEKLGFEKTHVGFKMYFDI